MLKPVSFRNQFNICNNTKTKIDSNTTPINTECEKFTNPNLGRDLINYSNVININFGHFFPSRSNSEIPIRLGQAKLDMLKKIFSLEENIHYTLLEQWFYKIQNQDFVDKINKIIDEKKEADYTLCSNAVKGFNFTFGDIPILQEKIKSCLDIDVIGKDKNKVSMYLQILATINSKEDFNSVDKKIMQFHKDKTEFNISDFIDTKKYSLIATQTVHRRPFSDDEYSKLFNSTQTPYIPKNEKQTPNQSPFTTNKVEINDRTNNTNHNQHSLTFDDIGGQDDILEDIKHYILCPLKQPSIAKRLNLKNKGFLFDGPPGTGKTLMAKIIAQQSGANFFEVKASELSNSLLGQTEQNWIKLYNQAKANQPSIIFVDEADAVLRKRGSTNNVYADQALNTILALMTDSNTPDEYGNIPQVYWIVATNFPDSLDPAVTRPERIGRSFTFGPCNTKKAVDQIFKIHSKSLSLDKDVNIDEIETKILNNTPTGAEIKDICDRACELALNRTGIYQAILDGTYSEEMLNKMTVNNEDFTKAIDAAFEKKQNIQDSGQSETCSQD